MRAHRDRWPTPMYPPWATGRFYGTPLTAALTSSALSFTTLTAIPIFVPNPAGITINKVGVEITVDGTAGHVMRFSLYDVVNGRPGGLVVDWGTVPVDPGSVRFQNTTDHGTPFSRLLAQGWHYIGFSAQSGTGRVFNVGGGILVNQMSRANEGSTVGYGTVWSNTPSTTQLASWTLSGHPDQFPMEQSVPTDVNMARVLVGT